MGAAIFRYVHSVWWRISHRVGKWAEWLQHSAEFFSCFPSKYKLSKLIIRLSELLMSYFIHKTVKGSVYVIICSENHSLWSSSKPVFWSELQLRINQVTNRLIALLGVGALSAWQWLGGVSLKIWNILGCDNVSHNDGRALRGEPVLQFLLCMVQCTHLITTGGTPHLHNRVGQSREIYSNSVPLSPPHWPYLNRIRPPSWPRVAVASSNQNTKLFTWRTWPGAGAVPKWDWAVGSQCGSKQRRANHTTMYIWYVATHGQSVITTELMIA